MRERETGQLEQGETERESKGGSLNLKLDRLSHWLVRHLRHEVTLPRSGRRTYRVTYHVALTTRHVLSLCDNSPLGRHGYMVSARGDTNPDNHVGCARRVRER